MKLRTTAIRAPLSGSPSSGTLVSASHCWTSQQWHPHFKSGEASAVIEGDLLRPLNQRDKLAVRLEFAQLAGELFHRVDMVHRRQRAPQHGGRVQCLGR